MHLSVDLTAREVEALQEERQRDAPPLLLHFLALSLVRSLLGGAANVVKKIKVGAWMCPHFSRLGLGKSRQGAPKYSQWQVAALAPADKRDLSIFAPRETTNRVLLLPRRDRMRSACACELSEFLRTRRVD